MVLILNTATGFSILLPFTLGKSASLFTLNPRWAIQLARVTDSIRGIRFVTDPIVDMRLVDAEFFHFTLGEDGVRDVTEALTSTYRRSLNLALLAHSRFGEIISAFESGGTPTSDTPSNSLQRIANWRIRMSMGRRPVEKAFAIVYGYPLFGISLAV
ncbi:hypothetical protein BDM02DRAFT_3189504 [Thelephora ganbajun]|uniref:Uncharacterized protein n=1 Tax=Thelephora ganbajun TaxID=370292 RepID=A0ACB6Z8U7_THEGA|nr:hypothetical protein BDM02DRAFT_3189504 [Thelephora ganbajun]